MRAADPNVFIHCVRTAAIPLTIISIIIFAAGIYLAAEKIVQAQVVSGAQMAKPPAAPLESRVSSAASTFTVNVTADTQDAVPGDGACSDAEGGCSLRAAITEANALAGPDVITLPAGTYTQTLPALSENLNAGGDWDITSEITINGAGPETTVLEAAASRLTADERVIHCIGDSTAVFINGVTLRHGVNRYSASEPGGGGLSINSPISRVTLDNVVASDNWSEGRGGGISVGAAGAHLTINHSSIRNNLAGSGVSGSAATGGGIDVSGSPGQAVSEVTIQDSDITGNEIRALISSSFGAGVSVTQIGAMLVLRQTTVENNESESVGLSGVAGGIYNQQANVFIIDSVVTGNSASDFDSGVRTLASTSGPANTTIANSQISGNEAAFQGAGVANIAAAGDFDSVTNIIGSTISGNILDAASGRGGAGVMNLSEAGSGGEAIVTMENSTISGNVSSADAGGIYNDGNASTVSTTFCTILGNSSGIRGGGLYNSGTLNIQNTIVANNSASSGPDIFGTIASQDYNHIMSIDGGNFVPLAHDVTGSDPLMGPLTNNGGPTLTHSPTSASPVINTIPFGENGCGTLYEIDQTGSLRPFNVGCEKGSVEYRSFETPPPTMTQTPTATPTPTPTPTVEPTATPCGNILFSENFDNVTAPALPAGWTAANRIGPPPPWVTTTVNAVTLPNAAFIDNSNFSSDKRLTSPPILINAFEPVLRFRNNFDTEFSDGIYWDGGVLEISAQGVDRGSFKDVIAAGGEFLSGGYTGVITDQGGNPLAGRMAWAGNSGGYIISSIRLPAVYVGKTIRLRFRMGTDGKVGGPGWYIDDVHLESCSTQTPTPTATPTVTPTATPTPTGTPTPVPSCTPNEILTDGTFEAGRPWPAWTVQQSTNFETPLCDLLTCGSGNTATGPFEGSNWAWFGGIGTPRESATLGRFVVIPADRPATLTFQMKIGEVSPPFFDRLVVRVDGQIVRTFFEPQSPEDDYTLRNVSLNQFADGQQHSIFFGYEQGSDQGGSSFTLDNISLLSDVCVPLVTKTFDYDGDNRSDISIYRPSSGNWYINKSDEGFFGAPYRGDKIVPADYDGDRATDIAVFRNSEQRWYILPSSTLLPLRFLFGLPDDLPVPADYDGDGKADIAVFRPSDGTWYIQRSSNGSFIIRQFGQAGDRPTIGDFDGDGRSDIALYRPSIGVWFCLNSSNGQVTAEYFGLSTDKTVAADYDGDGKADIAVYRPSDGIWYIHNSATDSYTANVFGLADDIPVPGDFDGDGKADIAVFRPSSGHWYIANSSNGSFTITQFGQAGDQPTQNAFGY